MIEYIVNEKGLASYEYHFILREEVTTRAQLYSTCHLATVSTLSAMAPTFQTTNIANIESKTRKWPDRKLVRPIETRQG